MLYLCMHDYTCACSIRVSHFDIGRVSTKDTPSRIIFYLSDVSLRVDGDWRRHRYNNIMCFDNVCRYYDQTIYSVSGGLGRTKEP